MINTQALALKLLLSCEDKDKALDTFEGLHAEYFSGMYTSVYSAIARFYRENSDIPTLSTLAVKFSRNNQLQTAVIALTQVDVEGIELELALEALRDEYAQQEVLKMLQVNLLENISMMSANEIIDCIAEIPLIVESNLQSRGVVLDQAQITIFQKEEDLSKAFLNLGISNRWDSEYRGVGRQEVCLFGGKTGSGKSVLCANIAAAQWLAGSIAPYYTIEMTGRETYLRILGIIAGVDALDVRNGALSGEALYKLAKVRSSMFLEGHLALDAFMVGKDLDSMVFSDFNELDVDLTRNHKISHPLVVIDDSDLSLTTIDMSLSKLVAKYGDKVTMAIVDYLNEVRLPGKSDPYDWVYQKEVATGFKNLARKHDVGIISPFQTGDDGVARFSKSILDPVDLAFVLHADYEKNTIALVSSKLRSLPASAFKLPLNWKTLAMTPEDILMSKEEVELLRNPLPPSKPGRKKGAEKPKGKSKEEPLEESSENFSPVTRESAGASGYEL